MRPSACSLFVSALALLLFTLPCRGAEQTLYLSAGDFVTAFRIDAKSGQLTALHAVELPGAGPIGVSADATKLYVNCRLGDSKDAAITTFAIAADGQIKQLHQAASEMSTGYVGVDSSGKFLGGSSYGGGTAALWKLDENGIYQGAKPQIVTLEKNAHSAVFSPDNRFLLVPATGPNKVFQLHVDAKTAQLAPNDPPFANGPQGDDEARQPRHLVFHPTLPMAYTTNEREQPGVGVWQWDAEGGQLKTVQNLISYPDNFDGVITTADLHFTPDGKFLYISNRDTTDRKARTGNDAIVGFRCDPKTGLLTYLSHTACEHVPRSFDVDDTGNFVYVAGQMDDRLGAYRIDPESGGLSKITSYEVGKSPSWVTCVTQD